MALTRQKGGDTTQTSGFTCRSLCSPNPSLCAQVEPQPFYTMCTQDTCDSPALGAACSLAAAFVHLCNRNFVPVEIPPQW